MLTTTLSGKGRQDVGSKAARDFRQEGLVPAVLYRNNGPVHFTVHKNDINKILAAKDTFLVDLDIDGTHYRCILRGTQFHPIHDYTLDAEFVEVTDAKPILVDLPLKLQGVSPGMAEGGKLVQKLRKVRVKGLAQNLPQEVLADISHLKLGKSMKVRDMVVEGFEITMSGDIPLATVEIPRSLRQDYAKDNPGATKK
jgi:large subunit ribosomal protein L25